MNKTTSETPTFSGLGLLIEWANEQDQWIRKLVSEVIGTR